MYRWVAVVAGLAIMLWSGSVLGQAKPACDPQGRVMTPQKVEGQVVKMDSAQRKLTVREANGTEHEFQASKETLQDLKVGDRIGADLRAAPNCP